MKDHDIIEVAKEFELEEVEVNTLCIERTFIDKIFSVKRHAICGTLNVKVRHIYDVTKLFGMEEIQSFLSNKTELKKIVRMTKQTDSYYLAKRDTSKKYNPISAYDFDEWKHYFTDEIRARYESLHENLLYSNEKQDFKIAITTFEKISALLAQIGE